MRVGRAELRTAHFDFRDGGQALLDAAPGEQGASLVTRRADACGSIGHKCLMRVTNAIALKVPIESLGPYNYVQRGE
jgi:hypothetical protein